MQDNKTQKTETKTEEPEKKQNDLPLRISNPHCPRYVGAKPCL